jgi:hypothetical protein
MDFLPRPIRPRQTLQCRIIRKLAHYLQQWTSTHLRPKNFRTASSLSTWLAKSLSSKIIRTLFFLICNILHLDLTNLPVPLKRLLKFNDLFGETKLVIRWTIDKPIKPGVTIEEKGMGFKFNQSSDPHQWVRATQVSEMKTPFTVNSILYQDGTRRDIE